MNASKIATYLTKDSDGYKLQIPVANLPCAGAVVTEINMFVGNDYDTDLAVIWEDANGNELDEDNEQVIETMGEFYSCDAFTLQLQECLRAAGFSERAAYGVSGSEWGMQSAGRASYDAWQLTNELRRVIKQLTAKQCVIIKL